LKRKKGNPYSRKEGTFSSADEHQIWKAPGGEERSKEEQEKRQRGKRPTKLKWENWSPKKQLTL